MSSFRNLDTNEIVRVMSEIENYYILDSGQRVDKKLFIQKYVSNDPEPTPIYENKTQATQTHAIDSTSTVDVESFFSKQPIIEGLDTSLKNIENLNTSNIVDKTKQEGWVPDVKNLETNNTITQTTVEAEKEALRQKHNLGTTTIDINDPNAVNNLLNQPKQPSKIINENGLTEAQELARRNQIELTGKDPFKDKIAKFRLEQGLTPEAAINPKQINEPIQTLDTKNTEDEVIKIFKKIKRNHNIKIKYNISDKIADPDFIKMMVDNLDGDIIQYYTDEIYIKFIKNIDKLKKTIYNQVEKEIYGNDIPKKNIKNDTNDTIEISKPSKKKSKEIVLIPGKKTKAGKQKYKFINDNGKIVELLVETAQKKQFKPATKKDLK